MCSYKAVKVFFEVWGLQTKVETSVHRVSNHFQCSDKLVGFAGKYTVKINSHQVTIGNFKEH